MNKSLLKDINFLIKDLDNYDYIVSVKYLIYLISKISYYYKVVGLETLNEGYNSYKSTSYFSLNNKNIFNEYTSFNLNNYEIEEQTFNILLKYKEIINLEDFRPAELYEALLTPKEKKNLGQVYTPIHIIHYMLSQLFNIKKINKSTKILDPSCGGGFFLIESFIRLRKELKDSNVDDKYIIENMLYGIDIDDFSIFLTKAGLLFASNCHFEEINFNIINLDFLTESFNIKDFDIIVGNPPYVGHKNSSRNYKQELYLRYSDVFYDKADISYCFFKKSKDILKQDGVISFITSRYFMEALYAKGIRAYIKDNFDIISLHDFSGNKVFKNALVSPALVTLVNKGRNKNNFSFVKYNEDNTTDEFNYNQGKLNNSGWVILKDEVEQLYNRIDLISNTYLKDVCTIKQGIITGYDKAFIVDENTIEKYNIESNLLRKWIKNSNISKSGIKYNNLYLIYSSLIENEDDYPNTIKYLSRFKEKLKNKRECIKGYRKWYELQWGRNYEDFENPKVIFPFKSNGNKFYYDENQYFCSADIYFMNNFKNVHVNYLLSYLNSNVFEFYFKCRAKKVGNNLYEYYPNKLINTKIFLPPTSCEQNISYLGNISIENLLKKVFNITEEEVNIIYKYVNKG